MCDVPEPTIQELLLATMTAPEHRDAGVSIQDLNAATGRQQVCTVHSLGALRTLHRSGHAACEGTDGTDDSVSAQDVRWRIPTSRQERKVGNYTYLPAAEIGHGRLGIVYRGRNEFLHRDVAMKFLSGEYTQDENFRQKFEREARILAHMDHPNIVKVYDGGQDAEGAYYIAMEYVEGGSLVQLTKKLGRLPAELAARHMYEVGCGLAEAHRHGILHRDVKPDNVMMTPDGAKLADFNLAAIEESALKEAPSAFGNVASDDGKAPKPVGTLAYMAPERANGERGDHRSDTYSLGATFYSVAAGQYLFANLSTSGPDAYMNWCWHHNKAKPRPLTEAVPGFPPALAAIIHRCLAKSPAERYQSYEELLGDLGMFLGKPALPGEIRRPRRTGRRLALAALAVVAVIVAFLTLNPFRTTSGQPLYVAPEAKNEQRVLGFKEPDTTKKVEPEEPKTKDEPKPKENPKPLADQLAEYDPTGDDIQFVRALLDLVGRERANLIARSYRPFLDELVGQAGDNIFRKWHLDAAREIHDLAEFAVQGRIKDLTTVGSVASVVLRNGEVVSGEVKESGNASVVIATDRGLVRFPFADLSPSNFIGNGAAWKAALAFMALSGNSTEALGEILAKLPTTEELLFWIPVVTRLAQEEARAAGLRRDFAVAHGMFARLGSFEGEVKARFGYLGEDFRTAREEKAALRLLLEEQFAGVVVRHPGSLAYGAAAERILERFSVGFFDDKALTKKLAAVDQTLEEAIEKQRFTRTPKLFDFVGGPACIAWTAQPPDGENRRWDRQNKNSETPSYIILRHPTDLQRLVYNESFPAAAQGIIVVYRFLPKGLDAHWKLGLETQDAARLYLRITHRTIELVQPPLGEGSVESRICDGKLESPPDLDVWRSLTLVPVVSDDGGMLLAFSDGNPLPILRVPLKDARISDKPVLAVFTGELHIKNLISSIVRDK